MTENKTFITVNRQIIGMYRPEYIRITELNSPIFGTFRKDKFKVGWSLRDPRPGRLFLTIENDLTLQHLHRHYFPVAEPGYRIEERKETILMRFPQCAFMFTNVFYDILLAGWIEEPGQLFELEIVTGQPDKRDTWQNKESFFGCSIDLLKEDDFGTLFVDLPDSMLEPRPLGDDFPRKHILPVVFEDWLSNQKEDLCKDD